MVRRTASAAAAVLILGAAALSARGSGSDSGSGNESGDGSNKQSVLFEDRYMEMSWDEITAEADGQSIFFYMWGGADHINRWVSGYFADYLKDRFNITLEMVPLAGAADYLNKVLGEKQAGRSTGGTVDMVWINGENFRTMREADLLFGPYAQALPNIIYCDPRILEFDFGFPIEGYESPYGAAQSVMEYRSERIVNPPGDVGELFEWVRANPGKFTYPAPPDFTGSAFVRHVFYYVVGGPAENAGAFQ